MSGEFEAAGALGTAGAVAGVIEGREPTQAGEGACLNCGTPITGRFCSNCGQATHASRKLGHMVAELLDSIFHLDTKLWRTLPMVLFRPGTITRNYVYGKRARYISPLAAFLFSIFLLFFAVSFLDAPVQIGGTPEEQRAAAIESLEAARAGLAEAQQELEEARAAPPPTDGTPPGLEIRLADQAVRLAQAEVDRRERLIAQLDRILAEAAAQTEGEGAVRVHVDEDEQTAGEEGADSETEGDVWQPGDTWQDSVRRLAENDDFVVVQGMPALNERVRQKFENPDLALYSIQEAASKFSFLLAPLSLPFIMLLFLWKRGPTMYDHIVYALYALSFAALLFVSVILTAQNSWTSWLPGFLLFVGLPVHIFFHLKGAYALGWWSALWRTFFMLIFAIVILCIFTVLVVVLGLAG